MKKAKLTDLESELLAALSDCYDYLKMRSSKMDLSERGLELLARKAVSAIAKAEVSK